MKIEPINAIVYNTEKINIKDVIAPPYDVIDDKYQDELYKRSNYNIVRLILSKAENRYEDSAKQFEEWKSNEILIQTEKPAIFYIIQIYTDNKGKIIERKGFIARNKVEEFETGKILPHEYTMGGPKQDRFDLITATKAFFSQIFMVYHDERQTIENNILPKYIKTTPFIDVVDDNGVENIVYIIDDSKDIELICKTMEDKILLIADGHHRYETSMKYAKEHKDNRYAQFVMSYFTNSADENLIIYPTHRIVEKYFTKDSILNAVSKYYEIDIETDKNKFLKRIEEENKNQITTGLIIKNDNNYYILKLQSGAEKLIDAPQELQKLDLNVLHELILKKELAFSQDELMSQNGIKYEKKEDVAFDSIKYNASACFIMAYPKMKDVLNISSAGYRMPQKSTYFYPKLLSGIVINPLA